MPITPFKKVTSREIYGADISGVQDAVNKLEAVLEMETAMATSHVLQAVSDQPEPAMHRRIYEGTIRNWLESPAPVIKRDGQVVQANEYTLCAAQGMVVFHQQQPAGATMTADFTYVAAASPFANHVGSGGGTHAAATAAAAGFMAAADKVRLDALDYLRYQRVGLYHGGITGFDTGTAAATVNTLDMIPFYVAAPLTYDRIAISVTAAGAAGTLVRLGLYADTGAVYPGSLVVDAGEVGVAVTGTRELPINITLAPGLYWTANLFSGTPTIRTIPGTSCIPIGTDLAGASIGTGFRASFTYGPLPNPAPSGATLLYSGRRGVFLRRA